MLIFFFIQSFILSFHSDATGLSDENLYFVNNNPAFITNNVTFGFKPNIFGLSELNDIYLSGNYKMKDFIINANILSLNSNELNNEIKIGFGGIYKFKNIYNLGLRFNYNNFNIKNYINENYFTLDLGGIIYLNDNLGIAGFYNNINLNQTSFITNNGYFSAGISSKNERFAFFIGSDILFNIKYGINSGINYKINDYLSFRIDYSTLIKSVNAIINIKYNNYCINLFFTLHNQLGFSQNYQFIYDY